MAAINNTRLAIDTDPLTNRATISVTCDVESVSRTDDISVDLAA